MIPKFRAWDKELKQMVYGIEETYDGLPYTEKNKEIDLSNYGHMSCFSSWLCGGYEVMQYTGLKDKNGIEIYEGDVLTSEHYPFQDEGKYNYHGIVEWEDEMAATCITKSLVNKSKRGISDGISDFIEDTEQFEVIGNILEDGDLLDS